MHDVVPGELRIAQAEQGRIHFLSVFGLSGEVFNIKLPFSFIVEEVQDDDRVLILTSSDGLVFVSKTWLVDRTNLL